ncbi:hypothetical protein N7467_003765 [Penicillium canescens]|nr:hypothetical protein N7467_003765 [Penicillium canescens]
MAYSSMSASMLHRLGSLHHCGLRGDAETACGENAVGSWTWVSGGNVTIAQNGQNSTSTCNTTSDSVTSNTRLTSSAQTTACTDSTLSHPSTIALGAGLGAGLGVPLLVSTILLLYCATSRRRLLSSPQQQTVMDKQTTGHPSPPSELNGAVERTEMGDNMGTRSELQGS